MSAIIKLLVSAILGFFSDQAKAWHEAELRDRRNRKVVTDAVKEVVDEAAKRNVEIADSPESIGQSIDRLRDFAIKRELESGGSVDPDRKAVQPLRFGSLNVNGSAVAAGDNPASTTEISSPVDSGAGGDSES